MSDIIRKEARLIILRSLHAQPNYAMSDSLLREELEMYGISRSRDFVREEINYLVDVGAVTKTPQGSVVIAVLCGKGVEHVERRLVIEGVKRMSAPE